MPENNVLLHHGIWTSENSSNIKEETTKRLHDLDKSYAYPFEMSRNSGFFGSDLLHER